MSNKFIFLASVETDLLILSGISKVLKDTYPQRERILLLPTYQRIYLRATEYRNYFDKVIEIKAEHFSLNLPIVKKNIYSIKQIYKVLDPYRESIFFLFDIYTFVELVVYSFVKKNKKAKMVTVTAFEAIRKDMSQFNYNFKGTFIKSFFSIVLTGQLFFEYQVKISKSAGINFFKAKTDLQLCIKNSKYISDSKKIYTNLPFPPLFLLNHSSDLCEQFKFMKKESIIFFIDSTNHYKIENYWEKTNNIINLLSSLGFQIYLKDHPSHQQSKLLNLDNSIFEIIPNEIGIEQIYLFCNNKIKAVFGSGTQALITASWLNIPSFDLCYYYNMNKNDLIPLHSFLNLSDEIIKIKALSDIEKLNIEKTKRELNSSELDKQVWKDIFVKEFGK